MNKEKDFFKTCFNIVVELEVKNESQAIAKEVVLSEIKNLQQENRQLKETIDKAIEFSNKNWGTWCSNHFVYMTELQNILKEVLE